MREMPSTSDRRVVLIGVCLVVFWFVWYQWKLLLLAFAGLLLAILLHSIASWVERHTFLNSALAYMASLLAMAGVLALSILLLGPRVITQLTEVAALLPRSFEQTTTYLQRTEWGTSLLNVLHRSMHGVDAGAQLTLVAKAIVASGVDLIVVLVIGFFGALDPRGYREGLLLLVPNEHRAQARQLSTAVVATLRSWLLGQLVPMAAIGVASTISLWILGVHLAFTLGLFTGIMIFIPYFGTALSGIPAVLLALQRSPMTALYVFCLYVIFHTVEGYLLTPLVQRRAVRLPPILTILSALCMWTFAGVLGVAVAAPLTAVGLALVKGVYSQAAASTSGGGFDATSA
jgi:predicted PurR-regulated permease PerM